MICESFQYQTMNRVPLHWLRHPAKQTALLRRIIDRVRNSLEVKVVLQTAVDEIATLLNLDRCCFFWYFRDTNRVQIICESTPSATTKRSPKTVVKAALSSEPSQATGTACAIGYHPLTAFGHAAGAIAQGELVMHSGQLSRLPLGQFLHPWVSAWQGKAPAIEGAVMGALAHLLVPVKSQHEERGFIACLADQPRQWSTAEVEFLQAIAQQLEIAIRQAQLYEQTQKQAQRERLVNRITAQTRQSFELETILTEAIAQLLEALQVDRCLVHLVEDSSTASPAQTKHLYEVCRPPFPASMHDFDTHGPITQWVMQTRQRVVITDVAQDERIGATNAEYQQAQIKSSLVVPVQTKETLHAILYLNQCDQIRYWSTNDQKLAQAVADQLAISIQQAHLYAQTQQQAAASAAQAQQLAATLHELRLTQTQLIQSEKISSLGRLVAGVAHEINNPINFIYGNVPYVETYTQDVLRLLQAYQERHPQLDPELQALIETVDLDFVTRDLPQILKSMRSGADRVRQIVLSLRNFSHLDEAHYKAVDIHKGIESTLLVMKPYLAQEIEIRKSYEVLPLVECCPSHLNQVFLSLLMNAVEALNWWPAEKKTIAICTAHVPATATEAERVRIVVVDNGPGIPHEIQPKIFDPFFTTKDVGQGAGLGLTVSYQTIVNQHQGQLTFYSEPGLGTEFIIDLPVRHTPMPHALPTSQIGKRLATGTHSATPSSRPPAPLPTAPTRGLARDSLPLPTFPR